MSNRKNRISKNQETAIALRDAMVGAISARVQNLIENEKPVAVEWAGIVKTIDGENGQGFVNALAALQGFIDFAPMLAILPNFDKTKVHATAYVQAKTVVKVVNLAHALAGGTSDKLSAYTLQVLAAALDNGGALSLQGAQASLSRRVAKPDTESITSRASYSVGTASAQSSQVRDVLRVLGLAEVNKGKRNDVLRLSDTAQEKLRALFAEGVDMTETESE